ncbi:translation initiation factor IF-2-like [Orcinus orca]|uniref:translation initiation factor IF-2-like n=1 Tax=Orcinus orca TaxID=9733 RepID=UPI0021115F26|nr:translation initiation factor IF-2-like [Orcinus orca]
MPSPTDTRTDTPPLAPGPGPGQTGIQTHPWGPPVALTAARQDGRAKTRTAATPKGPRRCCCQRPSARLCPRRRPTSRASACPRAGAAAGPAAQAGGRGRGGAADQPGEGAARRPKTHPRPARRHGGPARPNPTRTAPPTLPKLLQELPTLSGWGTLEQDPGSRILDPRQLPLAPDGSRKGQRSGSQGLGGRSVTKRQLDSRVFGLWEPEPPREEIMVQTIQRLPSTLQRPEQFSESSPCGKAAPVENNKKYNR